jgi:hypothetical protein
MGITRPQILTTEKILTSFVSPAGDRVAAMIGTATWGPIDTVTLISTLSDFVNAFGDDKTGTGVTGIKGADLFFRNGGTLKFVRIEDGDADYADYSALITATPAITFKAKYKGTYGNNIAITVTANETTAANRDIQITDGNILEIFNANGSGYATNALIATALASSRLVTATVETGQEATIIDAFTKTYLTGGDDGEDSLATADYTDAIDNLLYTEEYNFLLVPGVTLDATHSTIVGKLNSRASAEKKYSRYITGIAKDETIATAVARTASGKRLTVVAPNVKYTHRVDGTEGIYDGSYLACAHAGNLCALGVQNSATHKTLSVDGTSILESTGKEYYTKTEQESLLQGRIVPITLIGNTIQASRAVTRETSTTSVFFEEVVVDIVDFVRNAIENYCDTTIGLPNTEERRAIWSGRIDAILANAERQEIIQEFQPSVLVEGESPDTYNATIAVKPSYSVNFVQLTININ